MSHVETFKTSIIRIRDLLRSQGITGMDSMRHICLYLMSRYMTHEKALALGIPDEFSWNALMTLMQKGDTVSATDVRQDKDEYALNHFYNKETECVVGQIDSLFGTEKFPFDVKCPIRHKETMKILSMVELDKVDVHMDVLGWVYEQHLKTGSSAARDLGQFFTDRSICTYMTELCRPAFKYPGVPESMCDPAMGTGGFQAAYMKYYKRYPEPVDWKIQHTEIHGCDTDQKVAGLARLNLFIESGGALFTHLKHRDSLYDDLLQTGYDVILANMPFGLKGLKHADCCERVRALKINGTKSEPLFLQLMMVSLNVGGRCAVVVPDGMLVNTSVCHNGTRKYLLDHFELKRVIKMSGKFFMNTTIQPSILFFENTGKPTATVEFWDVVADGKGAMTETMVLSVPRASLDETCSLDMRRYQEVKVVANPAGFQMVKLGELVTIESGKYITKKEATSEGYPIYGGGDACDYYSTTSNRSDRLVVAKDGVSLKCVRWVSGEFHLNHHGWTLQCIDSISEKYLYYYLSMKQHQIYDMATGSAQKGINQKTMEQFEVVVPPLAIQQEIVATLDRIYQPGTTELADTIKLTSQAMDLVLAQPSGATLEPIVEAQRLMRKSAQMVTDVKAQMAAIVKSVGGRGFPEKKLSEACDISKGKRCLEAVSENGYPYQDVAKISRMVAKYILDTPAVLTPRVMSIGRFVYVDEKCHPSDDMFILKPKDGLHPKYLYGYCSLLLSAHFKESLHGVKPTIDYSVFDYTNITIPPLAFQHALVARLDALQSQLATLESLQRQSEDNARFILESYLHTGAPRASSAEPQAESDDDEKEEPLVIAPIRRPRSVSPARAAESDASGHASAAVAEAEVAVIPDYASMSLAALKELVKARGLRGLSGKKKEELVFILRDLS